MYIYYAIPPALTSHPRKHNHHTSLIHQKWILTLRYANLSGDMLPHLMYNSHVVLFIYYYRQQQKPHTQTDVTIYAQLTCSS